MKDKHLTPASNASRFYSLWIKTRVLTMTHRRTLPPSWPQGLVLLSLATFPVTPQAPQGFTISSAWIFPLGAAWLSPSHHLSFSHLCHDQQCLLWSLLFPHPHDSVSLFFSSESTSLLIYLSVPICWWRASENLQAVWETRLCSQLMDSVVAMHSFLVWVDWWELWLTEIHTEGFFFFLN